MNRRELLYGVTAAGFQAGKEAKKEKQEEEVSPAEDLMREHGVLKRILLVYRETIRRIDGGREIPAGGLASAAKIIRSFVEDYHEKLEEEELFPRFRKAGRLVDLVNVLETQHKAGRALTDRTLRLATAAALKNDAERKELRRALDEFVRMYEPHEAREDTVLFPAFHKLLPEKEYDALGDRFEARERQLFGEDGFEKSVERIAGIEKQFGIYDLAEFTPKA